MSVIRSLQFCNASKSCFLVLPALTVNPPSQIFTRWEVKVSLGTIDPQVILVQPYKHFLQQLYEFLKAVSIDVQVVNESFNSIAIQFSKYYFGDVVLKLGR